MIALPDLDLLVEETEPEESGDGIDDDSDFVRQELGPRWTGERRVSFPSPDKLAVYQEPKEDDFNLCKKSSFFLFCFGILIW